MEIKNKNMSLSVVLPVYNEEKNIRGVVASIVKNLPSLVRDYEIIVVDDGSVDGTAEALEDLRLICGQMKVIRHEHNKGYGAALSSGFKASGKDLILVMDSDGQFDISEVKKLLPWVDDHEIIAGFREKRMDPFFRRFLGFCFNRIVNILFGIKMKDVNYSF